MSRRFAVRRPWFLRPRALFEAIAELAAGGAGQRSRSRRPALGVTRLEDRTVPALTGLGEFEPHTTTAGDQHFPAVAADALGNSAIVWQSSGQDGEGWGIYGQRYDFTGQRLGEEFPVNTHWQGDQTAPAIAMTPDGAFVVVWVSAGQDGSETGIYGQRFSSAGIEQGDEFRVNGTTTSYQLHPAVAMGADGAFVAVWQSYYQDGSGYGIFGQRFNASGVGQGEFPVNATLSDHQWYPTVAVGQGGNFLVAWQGEQQDGDGAGIFAQRYNAAGVAQGLEFPVSTTYVANQMVPASASVASDGSFAIGWQSNATGDYDVIVRAYDAAGVAQTKEIVANTYRGGYQGNVAVAMSPGGNFLAAWESSGQDTSASGVYAQQFGPDGARWDDEFRVNEQFDGTQWAAKVAADGRGNFVATWMSAGHDGNGLGVVGQRFAGECNCGPLVRVQDIDPTAAKWGHDAAKGISTAAFEVRRSSADLSQPLTVYYTVVEGAGSATPGVDYVPLTGSVTIAAGQRGAGLLVTPTNNATVNGSETVTIQLSTSPDYKLDLAAMAYVTIAESYNANPPPVVSDHPVAQVGMSSPDWNAAELPGGVTSTGLMLVSRAATQDQAFNESTGQWEWVTHTNTDPIAVGYTVSQGAGQASNDFVALTGTVSLPQGVMAAQIVLTPQDDTALEDTERVTVTLSPGSGYSTLLGTDHSWVDIQDNERDEGPTANADLYAMSVDSPSLTVSEHGVLINDVVYGDGPVTAGPAAITTDLGGSVTLSAAGTFTYTPTQALRDTGGTDTFTYTVTLTTLTGQQRQAQAQVVIHVVRVDLLMAGVAEEAELTVGGFVPVNANNDNSAHLPDELRWAAPEIPVQRDFDVEQMQQDDPDLIPVSVSITPNIGLPGSFSLASFNNGEAQVRLWKSRNKTGRAEGVYDQASLPTIYVEGARNGRALRESGITLSYLFANFACVPPVDFGSDQINLSVTPVVDVLNIETSGHNGVAFRTWPNMDFYVGVDSVHRGGRNIFDARLHRSGLTGGSLCSSRI